MFISTSYIENFVRTSVDLSLPSYPEELAIRTEQAICTIQRLKDTGETRRLSSLEISEIMWCSYEVFQTADTFTLKEAIKRINIVRETFQNSALPSGKMKDIFLKALMSSDPLLGSEEWRSTLPLLGLITEDSLWIETVRNYALQIMCYNIRSSEATEVFILHKPHIQSLLGTFIREVIETAAREGDVRGTALRYITRDLAACNILQAARYVCNNRNTSEERLYATIGAIQGAATLSLKDALSFFTPLSHEDRNLIGHFLIKVLLDENMRFIAEEILSDMPKGPEKEAASKLLEFQTFFHNKPSSDTLLS